MASYDVASIICQALPEESCPLARAGAGRGGVCVLYTFDAVDEEDGLCCAAVWSFV